MVVIFLKISEKTSIIETEKLQKWKDFLKEMNEKNDYVGGVSSFDIFYEIFERNKKEIMELSQHVYQSYFPQNIILSGSIGSNVSDQEKIDCSDNLCLFGMWLDAIGLNENLEKEFLQRNELRKYIKILENQMNLLATAHFKEFRDIKRRGFQIIEKEENINESGSIEFMNNIYKRNLSFFINDIRNSDRIYQKFLEMLKDMKIFVTYCNEYRKGFENVSRFKTAVVNIRERIKNKIKNKSETLQKHLKIYDNFWEFIQISLETKPKDQDSLKERCRENFMNIVQNKKYVIFHVFKEYL